MFKAEAKVVFDRLMESEGDINWDFTDDYNVILDDFMNTPLEHMRPAVGLQADKVILRAAEYMRYLLQGIAVE